MKYDKAALSLDQQADLLLERGLFAPRQVLIDRLRVVSYYRLSGYLFPYRVSDNRFRPNTTLNDVWRRYTFDRHLRLIVLDAIERVEVAVRSQLVNEHVLRYGPFGYTDPKTVPKLDSNRFGQFLTRVYNETRQSREMFVMHFQQKYGDQQSYLPLWMISEILPYGAMFAFFTGVEPEIKRSIAFTFGIPDAVLFSWLNVLNMVRNICAHHGRLWNRELGIKPLLPNDRKYPQWHDPVTIPTHRVFAVLTILRHMTFVVAPQSLWPDRVRSLLAEYPEVPRLSMGFPSNWEECPIWC